jgi:4-hydroxy-2-oxoheptanedioate aldolase
MMEDFVVKKQKVEQLWARARQGKRPLGLVACVDTAEVVELAPRLGFDWVLVNQEHTPITTAQSMETIIRASEAAGVPYFTKLASWDPTHARDSLDLGAYGIQVPFVSSRAFLREVFEAIRFPPYGKRGICTVARATWYGVTGEEAFKRNADFLRYSNDSLVVIPLIENVQALEKLDEILDAPEIAVITIGPIDLALSLGIGEECMAGDPEATAQLVQVLNNIVTRARAKKKLVMGQLLVSHDHSMAAMAENLVAAGLDLPYVADMACLAYGYQAVAKIRDLAVALPGNEPT